MREWHEALDNIWNQLAERYRVEPEFARALMNGTLCLIRGMIAQSIIRVDPAYYAGLSRFLKRDVRAQLAGDHRGRVVPIAEAGRARHHDWAAGDFRPARAFYGVEVLRGVDFSVR